MKQLLTLFALLIISVGYTQIDTTIIVERSPLTGGITTELPFDRVFYLKEAIKKGETPVSLVIYKMHNGQGDAYTKREQKLAKRIYGDNKAGFSLSNKGKLVVTLTKKHYNIQNGKIYLKIFPLNPATSYRFEFVKSKILTAENIPNIKAAYNLEDSMITLVDGQSLEGWTFVNDSSTKELFSHSILNYKTKELNKAIGTLIYYDEKLGKEGKKLKEKIKKLIGFERDTLDKIDVNIEAALKTCYDAQMSQVQLCDTCEQYLYDFKPCKDSCFEMLLTPPKHLSDQINKGLLPLVNSYKTKKKEAHDFKGRRENITGTIVYIEKLLSVTNYQIDQKCQALMDERTKLYAYLAGLQKLETEWKSIVQNIKTYMIGRTQPLGSFGSVSSNGNTGGAITLSSKGKFVVRPDFGVGVGSSLVGANEANGAFTKVAPFMGVRLNLRPLDVNLPYRQIMMKRFMHHSSINLSFTTNSFSDGVTRFDLFKKQNFLIGYGYRLNNAMNLSAGAIVYQRLNPDPFISSNQLAVMPYVGFSIDFEILETFNQFINVFTK